MMPHGSRHCVSGILLETVTGYALETQDGDVWRLDVDPRAVERQIGRRITAEGAVVGDGLLHVRWLQFDQDQLDLVRCIAAFLKSMK
jgi:hypothetical protein